MLPVPSSGVVFCEVDDGAVLMSTSDEIYFGLNEVGVRIWRLLPPACSTLDELCVALSRQYPEIPAETLREDVTELLKALEESKLIGADSGDGAAV